MNYGAKNESVKELKSVIIGAELFGLVFYSYLREAGVNVVGFLDDEYQGKDFGGIPIIGKTALIGPIKKTHGIQAIYCAIENNRRRAEFFKQAQEIGYETPSFIHPTAIVATHSLVYNGSYVLAGAVIMPFAVIEKFSVISAGANVGHGAVLGEGVSIANGVKLGADVGMENFVQVGAGATITTGTRIGEDCVISEGAVVTRSIPPRAVVDGHPAEIVRMLPEPKGTVPSRWKELPGLGENQQ